MKKLIKKNQRTPAEVLSLIGTQIIKICFDIRLQKNKHVYKYLQHRYRGPVVFGLVRLNPCFFKTLTIIFYILIIVGNWITVNALPIIENIEPWTISLVIKLNSNNVYDSS
ncbi:hypothetical protein DBR11_04410 [Pedobacter sp. HMWF019]|nr:hypothetical protein DBR11_04410 [Pedobacter sp. HMWF019]